MRERAAALASADPGVRQRALADLGSADPQGLDEEDLRALVACLGHPRKAVQRPAAETCAALLAARVPLRPLLLDALESREARLRWGAAYALGRADDDPREALGAALEALGNDDGDVRWAAAEIVQRLALRHGEVVEALRRALDEQPAERRKMALYCLRDLRVDSDAVRSAAVRAAGDADEGVALAALAALRCLAPDDEAAVAIVLGLLASTNPRLQRAAASALADMGRSRPEVEGALREAAAGDDQSLRRAAEGSLRRRGAPPP